jgi:integrase
MRLTDPFIRSLKVPERGAVVYQDDIISGFGVRVSEGGTKSFVLTHGPRRTRETIGRVGVITLTEARAEAKTRLAEYTLGKEKPRSITWDAAIAEYLEERKPHLKFRTFEGYEFYLTRHFRFGVTKLSDITPHDLIDALKKLGRSQGTHHQAYCTLRAFIRWAHRRHYVDRSPMERMQTPPPCRPRERILTDDELRRVWLACRNDSFGRIIKLLILTGQRRGEITHLTGSLVGEDTITIPAPLAKNSRKHVFPLGELAKGIIGRLPPSADACLFPAEGCRTPFNGFSKCKPKLDKRAGVYDWTIHDLRRTFASGLAARGVALPVIERLLNHISGSFGGIVGVYQRYDFMPEMREAITKWEAFVSELTHKGCWAGGVPPAQHPF